MPEKEFQWNGLTINATVSEFAAETDFEISQDGVTFVQNLAAIENLAVGSNLTLRMRERDKFGRQSEWSAPFELSGPQHTLAFPPLDLECVGYEELMNGNLTTTIYAAFERGSPLELGYYDAANVSYALEVRQAGNESAPWVRGDPASVANATTRSRPDPHGFLGMLQDLGVGQSGTYQAVVASVTNLTQGDYDARVVAINPMGESGPADLTLAEPEQVPLADPETVSSFSWDATNGALITNRT